jgi:hypothetical protein
MQLLDFKSPKNVANKKIIDFLNTVKDISYIKYISEIDFSSKDKLEFIKEQKKFYDFHKLLSSKTSNIELIFLTSNALNKDNIMNLSNLIQYIITNCQNSPNQTGIHLIKIVNLNNNGEENEEEDEGINDKIEHNQPKKESNDVFAALDKFIQIILYLLNFDNKKRKLVIDYYSVYDIKLPKTEIENNKKIEKLLTDKNDIFTNNLQEGDIEDADSKANTLLSYTRQKLVYEWFIPDIMKFKVFIIYILDIKLKKNKGLLFAKLNNLKTVDVKKDDNNKIKKTIFSYIFQEKSNKYFFTKYTNENQKKIEVEFEKIIFE